LGYKTIRKRAESSFTEKKSEFIGYISPAETEEEAIAFINEIRAMHRKATHNCYAYILRNNNTSRHSDDGEPGGTAGMPIYDVLSKNGITDVVCVVTRYFGGILLGTGGLVHAYSKGASTALANSDIVTMEVADSLKISCDYTMYGMIGSVLPEYEAIIRNTEYSDIVCVYADVKAELTAELISKLIDKCNGKVDIKKLSNGYVEF
jgi:uncharacterized YigZ family protein